MNQLLDCSFPSRNGWSKSVFDYHAFSLVVTLPIAYFLLSDVKLERFYYPLAVTTKASVILGIVDSLFYISYLPHGFESMGAIENCGEIVLGRILVVATLFGEMHLVYFLSKALGQSRPTVSIFRRWSLTLSQALTLLFFVALATGVVCIFYRSSFGSLRNFYTLALVLLQYQQISTAKARPNHDEGLIRPNDATVAMYEKLVVLQAFMSVVCITERVVRLFVVRDGMDVYNTVRLVLDSTVVLLFYLKVLLVQERANVEVIVA